MWDSEVRLQNPWKIVIFLKKMNFLKIGDWALWTPPNPPQIGKDNTGNTLGMLVHPVTPAGPPRGVPAASRARPRPSTSNSGHLPWTSKIMHFGGILAYFGIFERSRVGVRCSLSRGEGEPERRQERRAEAPQAPRDAQTCPGCSQCCPYRFAGPLEHPTDPNRGFSKSDIFFFK